jgi:N-acetylmuramoyl-L-alanine amidase
MMRSTRPTVSGVLALGVITLGGPAPGASQTTDDLVVRGPDLTSLVLMVEDSRGYATLAHEALSRLGWATEVDGPRLRAQLGSAGPIVEFFLDNPIFLWDEDPLQLVSTPFSGGGSVQIPLQFFVDFLPALASEAYSFSSHEGHLEVLDVALWGERDRDSRSELSDRVGIVSSPGIVDAGADPFTEEPAASGPEDRSLAGLEDASSGGEELGTALNAAKRVVVIDPGHGGRDPGTTGSGGRREKDIALAIGRQLARELSGDEDLEVYLTRDRDVLVPLWERGPQATQLKGERPGLFISIHVNSAPSSPSIRGFETYFLSEARTEDERRVAAIENAPLELEADLDVDDIDDADLSSILRELRNLDHQHWSALLAEGIQGELEGVHPGPNRGVKQGPFAVITNVLMPAVLVELGFITNREEERVLSTVEFQLEVASALAQAVRDFFDRYPPEQGAGAQGPR